MNLNPLVKLFFDLINGTIQWLYLLKLGSEVFFDEIWIKIFQILIPIKSNIIYSNKCWILDKHALIYKFYKDQSFIV